MMFSGITTFFASLWGWIIAGCRLMYRAFGGKFRILISVFSALSSFFGIVYIMFSFLRMGVGYWQEVISRCRDIASGAVTDTLPGAGPLSGLLINAAYLFRFDYLAAGMVVLVSLWVALLVWRLMRALLRSIL